MSFIGRADSQRSRNDQKMSQTCVATESKYAHARTLDGLSHLDSFVTRFQKYEMPYSSLRCSCRAGKKNMGSSGVDHWHGIEVFRRLLKCSDTATGLPILWQLGPADTCSPRYLHGRKTFQRRVPEARSCSEAAT